ncbi:hypothetical protein [Thiobacillus sp.]
MEHLFNGLGDSIPEEVGQLAALLHEQRCDQLSIEYSGPGQLTSDPGKYGCWVVQGSRVEFSSIEARNHCVAFHAYREKLQGLEEMSPLFVFDVAHGLWCKEIGHQDSACGRFLALASDHLNVLQVAANLINTGNKEVFDVLHVVEATLKYLPTIAVEDLCAITVAQHPKTGQDLARGLIFSAIEETLVERPLLAWELYGHLRANITDPTMNLTASALLALAKAGEVDAVAACVLEDVESENMLLAQIAIWIVARLMNGYGLPAEIQNRCIVALRNSAQHPAGQVRQSAIQAIAHASAKHPMLLDDLLDLARSLDKNILAIVADHFFMNADSVQHYEALPEFLDILTHLPPDMGGTLNNVDWVLSRLLTNDNNNELVLRYLRTWVINHGSVAVRDKESIEHFDQAIMALIRKPQVLQRLITEWLSADEKQLAPACSGLISFLWVRGFRELRFSREVLDRLGSSDLIHLVRRMLGFVFSEEALQSLTFSLLDTENAPARTYGLVHSLLTDEVGRDYVTSTLEATKSRAESAPPELKTMLDSAHAQLTIYIKAIEDLPKLQELQPPFQLRRAIALRRSAEMRETLDAANDQSVFLKLVRQVHIKAGMGYFSIENGGIGETSHLQSFSHEVTLPRRYMSDPVGYAIAGLRYRIAKRGDE